MNFDEISSEEDLLNYWELVFNVWKKTPEVYSKLLSYLDELFNTDFEDYAPIQLVGDYRDTSNKLLVLSLHPSANKRPKYLKFEHEQRKFSSIPTERKKVKWESQIRFVTNFFTILKENNQSIPFFTKLEKLIQYYEQSSELNTQKYDLLQKRIINVDILPFYTKKVTLSEINPVLEGSFKRIKKFYFEKEFDTLIINGKMLYDGLLSVGFVNSNEKESKPITVLGKELKIGQFEIQYNGLKKKGIAIPFINNLNDEQKKIVAGEMKKATEWNRENSWEVIPGQL